MKEIKLTQGQFALVDDDMFEYLNQWKWYAHKYPGTFYAKRAAISERLNKQTIIKMHRIVLGLTDEKVFVDHVDGNGLNNQRSNLRTATNSQNQANKRSKNGGTSKYLGVSFFSRDKKWISHIKKDGKGFHLGVFENEQDAAAAYNEAALKIHGEFAKLNVV